MLLACSTPQQRRRALARAAMLVATPILAVVPFGDSAAAICENTTAGVRQLYWGDLHVHTAYSLDAYAFGAVATPKEAYAFAKGQPLMLETGEMAVIDRPLDFTAVTDHAESYEVMYLCTDPLYRDDAYCRTIREGRKAREGRRIFNDFLLPLVSDVPPRAPAVCGEPGVDCDAASASQWRRTQFAANEANEPCEFTALIGYEWSPSPGGRHWHRNVIFRSDRVPEHVVDYVRFPEVTSLWRQLAMHCRAEDGCAALAIPHNLNLADGGPSYDVETASEADLQARARYERLAEIHQEKGNSECLPEDRNDSGADCAFELMTDNAARARLGGAEDITPEAAWGRARSVYYRSLLGRGLAAYARSDDKLNPMMLGAIGSTDTHFGTAGDVSETGFTGGISSLWLTDEERLARPGYNPGGLVAVWAEENTREAIFDALHERRAYATSGPRIKLEFGATRANACDEADPDYLTPMGGTLARDPAAAPTFTVRAARDDTRLAAVHIVKGELRDGALRERTLEIATFTEGRDAICVTWTDPDYDAWAPAYWYARVLEQPSARWSKLLCERAGLCDRFPDADRTTQERAWSSPIWNMP